MDRGAWQATVHGVAKELDTTEQLNNKTAVCTTVNILKKESESEVTQSCPTLCEAHQAPLSMGFSRQEYWSGLPFPSPGDLPNPGVEPRSPALQADALSSEPPGKPQIY